MKGEQLNDTVVALVMNIMHILKKMKTKILINTYQLIEKKT